ncbi:MAG: ImmA/IrrE family metallo-endopeptidase [Deltaproteobacteria bacterium]|jgi:Zn-dependent peptidase ImmA (M78 family)|nr:ImmA/IrrE family metallo-endopeptidase [Deltaproteobacteria bacterium]
MKYPKIKVSPANYIWAMENSHVEEEKILRRFPKVQEWISGEDQPSMRELSIFSEITHIPLGYFFLNSPPTESRELIAYRSLQNHPHDNPSKNLLDTIGLMINLQDFMREHSNFCESPKNKFTGSLIDYARTLQKPLSMAKKIRKNLNVPLHWFNNKSENDINKNFNLIRSRIQDLDIMVMMNGFVGTNTRRKLSAQEFRAFTMLDDYAPLIFINANVAPFQRLFSLLYELGHVALGVNDLYDNFTDKYDKLRDSTDRLCSAAASEILVPSEFFIDKWSENKKGDNLEKVSNLAQFFQVDGLFLARRALDLKLLSPVEYTAITRKAPSYFQNMENNLFLNFYAKFFSGFDLNCLATIDSCVHSGELSYTEAYRLTGLNRTTFDKAMLLLQKGTKIP